jgi:hypothetical protein
LSWSLNVLPVDPPSGGCLAAAGRALYIAAQFEDKCKYLLRVSGLARSQQPIRWRLWTI